MELMESHHINCILKTVLVLISSASGSEIISNFITKVSTYDHRVWKTGLPIRSAILKPQGNHTVNSPKALGPNFYLKPRCRLGVGDRGAISIAPNTRGATSTPGV